MPKMIALPCRLVQCSGSPLCSFEGSIVESRSLMGPRLPVFSLCVAGLLWLARLFYPYVGTVLKSETASHDNAFSILDSIQNLYFLQLPNTDLHLVLVGDRIRTDNHDGIASLGGGQEG